MNFKSPIKSYIALLAVIVSFCSPMFGQTQLGEITNTSASCNFTTTVCNNDTIEFEPTNTANYTNFKWFFGSINPANLIVGPSVSQHVISVAGAKIRVATPYGTYILTGEYTSPAGLNCSTLNDTIVINYYPEPLLTTVPDTICSNASESSNLASLVTDANATGGTLTFYTSYANAFNETSALSLPVSPASDTKYYVRSETVNGCYDIDSMVVVVRCLSIGNYVWYDTNNNGTINASEQKIPGVDVNLFLDANNDGVLTGGELTAFATTTTDVDGLYLFENLKEGKYFVGIPSTEFGASGSLDNLYSSGTTISNAGVISETNPPTVDANPADTDDNGGTQAGGNVLSSVVTLKYNTEPVGESPDNSSNPSDANDNLTVDFGFYGMSLGSFVFMDINNSGNYTSGDDMVAPGIKVRLYSGDGSTVLDSTITDANGKYLFTNLAAGNYLVAVVLPSDKLSSDNIATSANPLTADNDDNGVNVVGTEVRSNMIALTPGANGTGETDQSGTIAGFGSPTQSDNALTPDANSELRVDFGLKPVCETITNPTGEQAICANDPGTNLTVQTSTDGTQYDIRFVRFDAPQTGNAMYTGGTNLTTADPTGASAPYLATYAFATADFPNASNTANDTFYVYTVLEPAPADPTCRPFQMVRVVIYPEPRAEPGTLVLCETTLGGGQSTFTLADANPQVLDSQTGMTVTYHATLANANNDASPLTTLTAANATTVFARVETANGCYMTSEVLLTVNVKPAFTLTLPDVCPGSNPTTQITLGAGAEANPQVSVNSGTGFAFSSLTPTGLLATSNGLIPGQSNTVKLTNSTGCDHSESIAVPDLVNKTCIPLSIKRVNN